MKNSLFPKTGWFYLWLVLASLVLWGDRNRAWNSLESLNLNIWSRLKQPIDSSTPLVRLIVPSSKTIKELSKLVVDYPLATFSVISEKMDFDQLRQQPEIYNRLTIYSKSHSSIRSIGKASPLDLLDQPQVKWLADARLDIAFHDSTSVNQVAVLWSANKSIYPAFIAHLLAKYFDPKQEGTTGYSELSFSANLLTINNRITRVGIDGAILPLEQNIGAISLSQLNQQFDKSFSGIILLDDLSSTQGKKITNGLASLLSDGYFVTATSTYLVELILYLTLALLVWKAWWKPLLFQIIFVVCFITVCLLLQILLAGEELWLSIKVYLILSVCSLFVFIGSYFERRKEVNFSKRLTELLSLSAPVFYQNESMEKLLPLLLHSNPDRTLIDNISQLAIKAESENKLMLSEKLYLWLAKNQWNSSPTQQNIEKQDSEFGIEQLDKTMVIKTDGKTFAPKVGGILSVKNFGRYQIEGILGKGAMGIVFQGVDPKINRYVAIKTLQLNDEMDGESMAESKSRFFREAETAGNLSHANIVTIYDVGEQQQDSEHSLGYIAMDLLTGAPLSEFIKQGKLLPSALVYQLMIQMTDALDYAHRQKVIHRDIKPANIIYDDELQRGTLTDFGIAYLSDHSKTKTGTIMGSPFYMSPEQVLGIPVDGRSDVFSLGVTFYQLLSGHLPFNGESIATVALNITKTKHESVRNWNKSLPTSAARITNKAMQKDASKRFQSMQEFKQALINALKRDYKKSPIY